VNRRKTTYNSKISSRWDVIIRIAAFVAVLCIQSWKKKNGEGEDGEDEAVCSHPLLLLFSCCVCAGYVEEKSEGMRGR
jgi:hypothetical protein